MDVLRFFLGALLLAIALEASTWCEKKLERFDGCLGKGYSPKIFTNCQAEGEAMTARRKIKRCTRNERRFSKYCDTGSLVCQAQSSGEMIKQRAYISHFHN